MGKLRCLAACLAILFCASPLAPAETAPAPFTLEDVEGVSAGLETVGDYAAALSPTSCSWVYQGAATGETYLTLRTEAGGVEMGEVIVALSLDDVLIDGVETGERETLPEGLTGLEARLVGARWLSEDYALPFVRGVKPGTKPSDVVPAFFSRRAEEPDYTIHDINPAVDETWWIDGSILIGGSVNRYEDGSTDYLYGWCTLDAPEEWREYYQLVYHIVGDSVKTVELRYFTDPE